jgi:hypothetical protein
VIETEPAMMRRENCAARRLSRLFRIERKGGCDRRPVAITKRLMERRGALIEALLMMVLERRAMGAQPSAELDHALAALAREVGCARDAAQARLEQIRKDLRLSRGEGLPTGIRGSSNGHTLGET